MGSTELTYPNYIMHLTYALGVHMACGHSLAPGYT